MLYYYILVISIHLISAQVDKKDLNQYVLKLERYARIWGINLQLPDDLLLLYHLKLDPHEIPDEEITDVLDLSNFEKRKTLYKPSNMLLNSLDLNLPGRTSKDLSKIMSVKQEFVRCRKLCAFTYARHIRVTPRVIYSDQICSPYQIGRCPQAKGALYNQNRNVSIWSNTSHSLKTYYTTFTPYVSPAITKTSSTATSLFCPPLSQFLKLTPETLRCGSIEKKLNDVKTGTVKWVKPEVIQFSAPACYCLQYQVLRYCFTNFFGPKEYKEEVTLTPTHDLERCLEACKKMSAQGSSSYILDLVPNYDCFWLQTRRVSGQQLVVSISNIIIHGPSKRVTGSSILDNTMCFYTDNGHCDGLSNTKILFHLTFESVTPALSEVVLNAEVKYTGDTPGSVTVYGLGSVFINADCHVPYLGEWYYQGGDGTLWGTGTALPVSNKIVCNLTQITKVRPNFFRPIFETAWELRRELLNCYTRKQVLLNSLKSEVPFDTYLLQGLTYGDSPNYALYSHKTGLYGADCVPMDYDDLEWAHHDVWVVKNKGSVLGCMDARLNIILRDCLAYNETRVREIDHQWTVSFLRDNRYEATRKEGEGAMINMLYDVSNSISEYLDSLITPPLYPPSTGSPSSRPSDFNPDDQNSVTTSSVFDWFLNLNLLGRIGVVLSMGIVTVAIISIIWIIIKSLTPHQSIS